MKKVHQFLGIANPIKGTFGIEIEAEGRNMVPIDSRYWKTEQDGSLRGAFPDRAAEYVLKKPITLEQVEPALDELIIAEANAVFDFSFRTSVHIHVNVQDLTEDQLITMIYTYLLIEEPMMNYCGRDRKGNRFCLRVVDADNIVDVLNDAFINGIDNIMRVDQNAIRYSSINIGALQKYGSLEFRGMRGNMDKDVLLKWINALGNLKDYAIKAGNPKEVLKHFESVSPDKFLMDVIGAPLFDDFRYPRMTREIQRSFSLTIDLPYSFIRSMDKREQAAEVKQKAAVKIDDAIRRVRARAVVVDDPF